MKVEADLHFLQGINQLVGHGWPYSPAEASEPGYRFYAAAALNDHNPWWIAMPDIAAYFQRVSFLLRQGRPANDVALYLPTWDAYAGFKLGQVSVSQAMDRLIGPSVIPQILDAGYNLDFIDDDAIAKVGIPYRALILPGVERMPAATIRKIEEYVGKDGIAIATRRAPSAAARLIADEGRLGEALRGALEPDVTTAPEIGFIHRKLDFAEIYFLVNTTNQRVHHTAAFRVKGLDPAWWDAFTGGISSAGAGPQLDLDLAPYESRIIVFSKLRTAPVAPQTRPTLMMDYSSDWKVTFGEEAMSMPHLRPWSEDRRFYSGLATYEKTVSVPESMLKHPVFLNFGEGTPVPPPPRPLANGMRAMLESPVREAAVVYVNGKRVGSVWRPPYQLEVSGLLHSGENQVRIIVGNLAVNRLAQGPLPDYKALIAKYGDRFQPQDMDKVQPEPGGLLGPVRLISR
jgi:hypothetical protein